MSRNCGGLSPYLGAKYNQRMSSVTLARLTAVAALLAVRCFGQTTPPPTEVGFLSTWGEVHQRYPYETWGQSTFPAYGANQVKKNGHHWDLWVQVAGPRDRPATWAAVKPIALKNGWTVVSEIPNGGFLVVLRYNQNGVEAWANAVMDDSANPIRMMVDLVEIAPPPIKLTLVEPAATPERLPAPDSGEFPYLAPLPGSVSHNGQDDAAPFRITPQGSDQEEIVANGSLTRAYSLKDLSQVLFAAVYHEALLKAGWEIVKETPNGELIIAHYSKKGRNLWAYLIDHGDEYSIRVGKEAAPDQMKTSLATNCHVALYGVLFDFNKSTLQAASNGALQQVATLLTANASLNVEVQGHTDNVGADAYNQTLSEARAKSVMTWLTQHGVAATRMTAKGYGKTMPIADNNTDEGRQKNRRVEIADPRCKAAK